MSDMAAARLPDGARALVEVSDLVKRFGDNAAVDGVSFQIREGEVFGLLGPNGAGKTTIISMISCLITPTSGAVTVGGLPVATEAVKVKRALGVVTQEIALYPTLTALKNLKFWGRIVRALRSTAGGARRGGARYRRARRSREGTRRDVLRGHEAAHQHRRRHHAPSAAAHHGRAHRRDRPAEPQPHPRDGQGGVHTAAVEVGLRLRDSGSKAARWVASDALRELNDQRVIDRLRP